jgi:DNA-binding NtrC family response regulator
MRHGAFAYLMKPLDIEELIRTLSEAVDAGQGLKHA